MGKKYEVKYDETKGLLELQFWGVWNEEDFVSYEQEFRAAVDYLTARCQRVVALVDFSDSPPQDELIQLGHLRCMAYCKEMGFKRNAHVTPKPTTALQMRRLSAEVDPAFFGHFHDRQEALGWLYNEVSHE